MLKQYDAEKVNALTAEIDAKETERKDHASHIQDMMGTGETRAWDNSDHLKFREHREKHDWCQSEIDRMKAELEAMETTKPVANADKANKASPLMRWLKSGVNGLDSHERADQEKYAESMNMAGRNGYVEPIFGAAITPAGNTNVLDETVVQEVVEGLDAFGGALQCFTVAMTANGNVIKHPVYNDKNSNVPREAAKAGEQSGRAPGTKAQQQADEIDETALSGFQQVQLDAYVRNTGFLDISLWMNEDVGWDVGAFVRRTLMRRMGRTIEEELTNGGIAYASNVRSVRAATFAARDNEPTGFVARAGLTNYSAPSGDKDAIKWEDFNTLIHSIDPGYLKGEMGLYGYNMKPGKVGFMCNWAMLGKIKNLSDTQNRPLIVPSIQTGGLDTLFGFPVFVNLEMLDSGFDVQHARPIYFGNWGYMAARFSGAGFAIEEHYDSATAVKNSNRYLGRVRYDSDYIGSTLNNDDLAIKALYRNVA